MLGQPRTTQRRARKVASDEGALRGDIVRLEEELTLLVPRLCGPVEDREQEPQVPFDRSIGHRLTARPHPAGSPVSDESIPVPLGQRGGISILAEELEEHLYRGPVVPPGPLTLGGGYLFTVDVKKRLQGEWLGLGLCRVLGLRRLARNDATVEGLAKRTGRTPDFIERALSWDAGSVSRWPVGSFGDLAPRDAQMSPRLDLRR